MRYLGGKSRLAKKFAPILIEALERRGGRFYEPFVGGFNVVPALGDAVKEAHCSDVHPGLITLYRALQDGWEPPTELSKERYDELRAACDWTNPLTAFAAFGCAFGGREWATYAGVKYAGQAYRSLNKKRHFMCSVSFGLSSYDENIFAGSVIYCDPPYKGTESRIGKKNPFDHDKFRKWCEDLSETNDIFVSEFSAPPHWEQIWKFERTSTVSAHVARCSTVVEYLYRPRPSPKVSPKHVPKALPLEVIGGVLHPRRTAWEPTPVANLPSWEGARRVAVDLETRDPNIKELGPGVRRGDGYVVGVGFAIDGGPAHYLPIAHEPGGNLDPETVWRYMRDQAAVMKASDEIVGANFMYDADWMAPEGVSYDCWIRDVQVAEPLIDEYQYSYSLDNILKRYGLPGKDEDVLRWEAKARGYHEKADLWKFPAAAVADYVIGDVRKPLALLKRQERVMAKEALEGAWDLESRVLPVALRMRQRGVRVSEDRLEALEAFCLERQQRSLRAIKHLTGVEIGVDEVMNAEACYRALGVQPQYTAKGKLSLTAGMLAEIASPVGKALLWARQTWKTRTMYCATFRKHMVQGRIHPTFNQCKIHRDDGSQKGAVSRRGSMDNPNFQQLTNPEKHPVLGRKVRQLCLPEEGAELVASDFSSQEPRIAVHMAVKGGFTGAEQVAQAYRDDPSTDLYLVIGAEIHPEFKTWWKQGDFRGKMWRKRAKDTFLGLLYGMGGGKLCRGFGLPTMPKSFVKNGETINYDGAGPEGQEIIDAFDRAAPFARELARDVRQKAERRGYIRLPDGGRRRYGPGKDFSYKAPNGLIQGTAALQTKTAMIEVDRAGYFLQIQAHDELVASVAPGGHEAKHIGEIMIECFPLEVPSRVDVEVGPSWGDTA